MLFRSNIVVAAQIVHEPAVVRQGVQGIQLGFQQPGNFAAFSAIPGVEVRTVFFDPVNSLVSGSMTEQQWIDGIKSASDQMRANIIE